MAYEVTLTTKNLPAIKNALHVYNCPHLGCPYTRKHQVLCLLLFVNMTSAMHMKMTKPDFDFC